MTTLLKTSRNRTPLLVLLTIAGALAVTRPAASEPPATAPSPPASAEPVVGPIAYFIDKCARCHGDISAPYVGLDKPKRGPAMTEAIDTMASGPAQAPLDDAGLKRQTELHNAIFDTKPFVWIDETRRDVVAGEVLPGTTLSFEPDANDHAKADAKAEAKAAAKLTITDTRFELPRRPGTLIATRGQTQLRLPIPP